MHQNVKMSTSFFSVPLVVRPLEEVGGQRRLRAGRGPPRHAQRARHRPPALLPHDQKRNCLIILL